MENVKRIEMRAGDETFDALRARIRDRFDELSPHLQRIAREALDQPNYFALNTVVVIAAKLGVQPSTLIRFAKEFDYKGFTDLQQVFRLRLIEGAPAAREQVYEHRTSLSNPVNMRTILDECIDGLTASLESTRRNTDPADLQHALEMIRRAPYIHVAGLRRSRPIATYLAYGLTRAEFRCDLLNFGGGIADQQVANMAPDDLLICIAFTPYAPPVVDAVREAKLRGREVISITDTPGSPLAQNSTLSFYVDNEVPGQFRPISGAIALVQTLIVGLTN